MRTIIWHEEATRLANTGLTHSQIVWITDVGVFESDVNKFNREFNSQLTWPQIKQFRRIMHRLLTDIVQNVKLLTETLDAQHPLYDHYQRILQIRNDKRRLPING